MNVKCKRFLCGLITLAVLACSLIIPSNVKADDMPSPEVLRRYQEQKDAMQDYWQDQAQAKQERIEDEYWYYHKYWWKDHYDVPYIRHNSITLDYGDTYRISGVGLVFESTNSYVASVDSNGLITAHNDGDCTIIARFISGQIHSYTHVTVRRPAKNNNNNTVYYPVYQAPAVNAVTVAASWNTIAANLVAAAPKGGIVSLSSAAPIYFDSNFINILRLRPDVAVNLTFGYNGHTFLLTIPKGYNLAGRANLAGCADFLTLSNLRDGKVICRLLY